MKFAQALLISSVPLAHALQDQCNSLVLAGGAVRGAYEAGALYGMYHQSADVDKQKFDYDVLTGVSAGAINVGAMSMFEKTDTQRMLDILSEEWQKLTSLQIFRPWLVFPIYSGLFRQSGLLNTQPLYNFVEKFIKSYGPQAKRDVFFSSVDANTGSYVVFDKDASDFSKAIVSSASIPFAFPSQNWDINGQRVVAMDGGSVWNVNIVSAIDACRKLVGEDNDKKINVDIILCGSEKLENWETISDNALSNYLRFKDLKDNYDSTSAVLWALQAFPEVNFRYWVEPTDETVMASGAKMLYANNATITWPMQVLGRKDGADMIKKGEGFVFNKIKEWIDNEDLKKQYPTLNHLRAALKDSKSESIKQEKVEDQKFIY